MKRYRLTNFSLDTSRNIFNHPSSGPLDEIKEEIRQRLVEKYGSNGFNEKFNRYMELQKPALSVVAEHTYLLEDICCSFVQGSMYSALTGACCLGERIFNDIIFKVLSDFKSSKHYKKIYGKGSIIDWVLAINILSDWKIIDNETKKRFNKLYKLRTESIHYQQKEQDLAQLSLSAINTVNYIIDRLFGVGPHRKDILLYFNVPGEIFIMKDAEQDPIAKAYYIPCSVLVGPNFRMEAGDRPGSFRVVDQEKYENREVSDLEFVQLRNKRK